MAFPEPVQGLVIRYSYLWQAEYRQGREEGVKDRPAAIVMVATTHGDDKIVTVLPITHTPPQDPRMAVEIPTATKLRLRLDGERSWAILSEANRFVWPGPDVRPLRPGEAASAAYGLLPYDLAEEIRLTFIALLKERKTDIVGRTE